MGVGGEARGVRMIVLTKAPFFLSSFLDGLVPRTVLSGQLVLIQSLKRRGQDPWPNAHVPFWVSVTDKLCARKMTCT